MDETEQQQVMEILEGFFEREIGDKEQAQEMVRKLAGMVQQEGVKLVHIGNTVFLTLVKGPGFVEFHPMFINRNGKQLTEDLTEFTEYLKTIGVKTAYTYSPPDDFYVRIIKNTGLPFESQEVEGQLASYLVL